MNKTLNNLKNEWFYTAKIVNFNSFAITYQIKAGFKSKEEAVVNQNKDIEKYNSDIKKIKDKYFFMDCSQSLQDNYDKICNVCISEKEVIYEIPLQAIGHELISTSYETKDDFYYNLTILENCNII